MRIHKIKEDRSESMFGQILQASEELDEFIARHFGKNVPENSYIEALRAEYARLTLADQINMYKSILDYHNLIVSEIEKGTEVTESKSFTERSLSVLGFETSSALIRQIRPDSVVEIFDSNLRQLWRSLSFFKYSSYPVSVLYMRPFPQNFRKDPPEIDQVVVKAAVELLGGNALLLQNITGEHSLIEVDSPKRMINVGSVDQAAPIFRTGRLVGLISVINVKRTIQAQA